MVAIESETAVNSAKSDVIGYTGDYTIQKLHSPHSIESEWKALQSADTACIYQNYDWVRIACNTLEKNNQIFIVTARNTNGLQFILPMVLEGSILKTLRWVGDSHANICSGLYSEDFLKSANKTLMHDIFKIIGKSIKGIAKSKLNNQPMTLKSYPNPMAYLALQSSVNNMYDMDLREGMDAILDQGSGKRKRKLWRKQNRVAESMGGCELVIPKTDRDIMDALEEFEVLKAKRLKELGITNVFSDQNTIDFLNQMATAPALEDGKLFEIFQLKIGGKTRAMYAYGIDGKHCQAYVNAVEYDDFAEHSPGEMVLYAMIEHLIAQGYEKLDLGVGDERYKVSWCPGKHRMFDTILPLSAFSAPIVFGVRIKNTVKRHIRNNPNIWLKLKKLRKAKAFLLPGR